MDEKNHIRDIIGLAACDTSFAAQVIITALERAGYAIVRQSELDRLRAIESAKANEQPARKAG